ncbi:MAG TPA: STELLO glycosyltransferase family protein [Chlamydiales bacterium]|nr:STELLO glycosyltransferase family protein [Chlamydiales bacterium]
MNKILFFLAFVSFVFGAERWIVVTTIQPPTPQLRKLAAMEGWRLVVVGDLKTPIDWHLDGCEYLSPQRQKELGYELSLLLPWNHYGRKNIGYLYAIEQGAKVIYETDDDNEPLGELKWCEVPLVMSGTGKCLNIYRYFGQPEIWPRGFPLDQIGVEDAFQVGSPGGSIGIEQGLVNGSPDVDAIFRLTQDRNVVFDPQPTCYLQPGIFCPFNSQNTFIHEKAFFTLYLPCTVSMRVSDIWRGYIAQRLIWEQGDVLAFSGPSAVQERNAHVLMHDFELELDLYRKGGSLVDFLSQWQGSDREPYSQLTDVYGGLVQNGFFAERENLLLAAWIRDFKRAREKKESTKW